MKENIDKIVVGIVPRIDLFLNNDPYADKYSFVNNYSKRVIEAGGIPVGLLMNDGELSYDELDLCDAFIIPGGNRIDKSIYLLLEYAHEHNKPVLGICMGMQAMVMYSVLLDEGAKPTNRDEYRIIYDKVKSTDPVLNKLFNNSKHLHIVTRNNIDFARHEVLFDNNSLTSELYGKEKVEGVSLHGVVVNRVGSLLNIVGASPDGIIEAVENKDLLWIGLQYHPEVDDNDQFIYNYIKEIERMKIK